MARADSLGTLWELRRGGWTARAGFKGEELADMVGNRPRCGAEGMVVVPSLLIEKSRSWNFTAHNRSSFDTGQLKEQDVGLTCASGPSRRSPLAGRRSAMGHQCAPPTGLTVTTRRYTPGFISS